MACGILVPQSGTEPVIPEVEAQSPNHGTTREFPAYSLKLHIPAHFYPEFIHYNDNVDIHTQSLHKTE